MTTSDASWLGELRVIGDLERADHWHLTTDDECAFLGEYTARKGYAHSKTNQIITNLKKGLELRGTSQWPWKNKAIVEIARCMSDNLQADKMQGVVVVPIPPSKPVGHPLYDDRMAQAARLIRPPADVRELLYTIAEREALHHQSGKRDVAAMMANIGVRVDLLQPDPVTVLLIDDVLTTGCSFKACKAVLAQHWPGATILGFFVARRVPEKIDPAGIFQSVQLPEVGL